MMDKYTAFRSPSHLPQEITPRLHPGCGSAWLGLRHILWRGTRLSLRNEAGWNYQSSAGGFRSWCFLLDQRIWVYKAKGKLSPAHLESTFERLNQALSSHTQHRMTCIMDVSEVEWVTHT
ncbi:MAG: hypothetical protein AAFP92_13505, partial [Bacteroidota bacterium]